jgi:hypothetical protein
MADYGKLLSRIWADPEFVSLDARAQQVYCLLISFSTRNLAGVLPITLRRWANSTRDATIENVTDALKSLAANKFVVLDWDTEELLIRTFIRNDEVYRQPNLMTAARKFCLQVQSPALKWALHEQLSRLPEHKDHGKTLEIANALIDGVPPLPDEGLAEGFGEPLSEGMSKGPGVGGYLSGVRGAPAPTPSPTPAAVAIPEPDDSLAATAGADLVRQIIPREHPAATQTALRHRASELINTGTPAGVVEAALKLWLTKPTLGPHALPSLVSEVIKARTTAPTNGIGKSTQKALGYRQLGAELIDEIHGGHE